MGGIFSSKGASTAPSAAQLKAQADQEAAVAAQEQQSQAQAQADAAARRVRGTASTGRALLLDDELGIAGSNTTLAKKLGG